ncbi:MAG: 3-deoxy-D-manno-octulosonic acid transferase [Pararhodobacter sp.]|nr:3-deoxy-D-manno-octulosonic acid transferase [Pararhodobacter sp.]
MPLPPAPALIRAYLAFAAVSAPLWRLALARRARRGKEDPARLPERFGHAGHPRPMGQLVWLHGVSVGETAVLLTLLDRLSQERPDTHFLLTSVTRAAADALGMRGLPARVIHQFAPVDCPQAVNRFLDHWRPDAMVLSEMDLWPCLLAATRARATPMLILNAHVTERRYRRRRRFRAANGWLMNLFDAIHVQDARSRDLFLDLGAPAHKMQVTGLLKAASAPPPDLPQARAQIGAQIGARPRWLAASTKTAEEPQLFQAHASARAQMPDLLMIVAPRQMAQADATQAAALARFTRQQIARRSLGDAITADTAVYIADTLGEMGLWYRLAPVAYTGNSMPVAGTPLTGKNPFEATALGVMILHGPHVGNFREAYARLHAEGGALEVADAAAMAQAVVSAQDAAFRAPFLAGAARVQADTMQPLDRAFSAICTMLDTGARR